MIYFVLILHMTLVAVWEKLHVSYREAPILIWYRISKPIQGAILNLKSI